MRLQAYAVAIIAAASCSLAACGAADARRTAVTPTVQPAEVLRSAFAYADDWWTRQGSQPPCPGAAHITLTSTDGEHLGFGYYGTCEVEINAAWWTTASKVLATGTRRGRLIMLEQICMLAIHERGHNIGYQHTQTGVMRAQLDVIPGGCVQWAAGMLPRVRVSRQAAQRTFAQSR